MSEPTSLLFAGLTLLAISALLRPVFLAPDRTKSADGDISDTDPLAEHVPLNILYRESQPMQKTEPKQPPTVTLNLAPWQLEVAVEVRRLIKKEAKQERYTAPSIEEIRMPV
jgi:hypothetical protein